MKARLLAPVAAALALMFAVPVALLFAAADDELDRVMQRIKAKAAAGKSSEADLAAELNQLTSLQAKYRSQKVVAAEMLFARAVVYAEVINDREMARILFDQVRHEYPGTPAAALAQQLLSAPPPHAGAGNRNPGGASTRNSPPPPAATRPGGGPTLSVGDMFPDFAVRDLDGGPLTIAQFRRKVVLVKFWATSCATCVQQTPGLMSTYRRHHDNGFEIIGISLDRDRAPVVNFVRDRGITWPQHFDAGGSLARRYNVTSTPTSFLLDGEGRIVGLNLSGATLERAVAKHTSR